jgi:RNA polymerase primary sigma factor
MGKKYKIDYTNKDFLEKTWDLIQKARKGNNKAVEELLDMYADYIEYMVNKYAGKTNIKDTDDLRSIIYMGFLEGVKRFDPSREAKFIYFTHNWMKKLIFSNSEKYYRIIRLPVNQSNFETEFKKKYPNIDDINIIMEATNYNISDIPLFDIDYIKYKKLDETKTHNYIDSKNTSIPDCTLLDTELIVESQFEDLETKDRLKFNINKALAKFQENEIYVLEHLFGLNNKLKISTDQIAINLNTSKVNVINIKNKLIKMLRHNMFKNILFNGL